MYIIIKIPYEVIPIIIPLGFGIVGTINYNIFIGLFYGLILSYIGRFYLDLPTILFNIDKNDHHIVHLYAIVIYIIT